MRNARRFTLTTLQKWDLEGLSDCLELVVSELVTNALRYALPASAPEGSEASVGLGLVRCSTRVVCAVRDPSIHGPVAKAPDFAAESGRGLYLVESFSETWGWHPLIGAGKVVWALFRLPDDEAPAAAGAS